MRWKFLASLSLAALGGATAAHAEVKPNSLFGDNAVLQRGVPLPVWGEAAEGENVSVEFGAQKVSTVAHGGQWRVVLKPLTAGGPFSLVIKGNANGFTFNNLLVGDVWVASGQSNMERQLGPRGGQPLIDGWEQEVAAADHPQIREFHVPQVPAAAPVADVRSRWTVCSPQTVRDYSAVGYFFARDLQKAAGVPIGILFAAWGGTVAEAWTSGAALKTLPEFAPAVQQIESASKIVDHEKALAEFFAPRDPGSAPGHGWAAPEFDASAWKAAPGDGYHTAPGSDSFEGVIWTRRDFELPPTWEGKAATLRLGRVDDNETTFLNGVPIGATDGWDVRRRYPVPANLLRPGRNVLAVRIVNTSGGGGMVPEDAGQVQLETADLPPVPLAGNWRYRTGAPMSQLAGMPSRARSNDPNLPTVLFNGMIAPLLPFPIKGAIWYQGESNQNRAEQYKTLFPLMISDWRKDWGLGDFPFLFVQIAPFHDMRPEIREAQLLTLQRSPNTAMAVTTDVGDANDIHPACKGPVGARLALAARALAYGEKIEYSGPLYQTMKVSGNRVTLAFTHVGAGLVARDGPLSGFVIAGADGKFVPARAEIAGSNGVVVSSEQVPDPTAVRFGWANVPEGNLFNREGLPASPFRTDDGPRATRADASNGVR